MMTGRQDFSFRSLSCLLVCSNEREASLARLASCINNKMRVVKLLVAAILPLLVTAKKAATSPYDVLQKKPAPISLTEETYDAITSAPRDYYSAIILTALDAKYACGICREFQPEWDMIGKSWQNGDKKGQHRVLFGTLDFDQGRNVFMKVSTTKYLQT